ncbi:hypothetical protein PaecuDRAFT_3569 [Paenibacillus curdlanolyticus YK9]|uniref:Uncharacterized protein n=1 Tax=Paenibacillus curdlanolyticus YK9 TaxID=717606 RepID=E0ID67_9BACL|nr:hypothetical protein [Paenibacillus curdlanolyticus]EFM09522.1 hypothetical protein PaecuDRAFT_3569 [Paenibacillus curdlanolyticus YK9]
MPGRYPLAAEVEVIDQLGSINTTYLSFLGDAYGVNSLGPNMDPCIFSDPLPWCWSYCRMGKKGNIHQTSHNTVVDATGEAPWVTPRLLNHEVRLGDVVFFGNYQFDNNHTISEIWVDTVLVVGAKEKWGIGKVGRKLELKKPPKSDEFTTKDDVWKYHFDDHRFSHQFVTIRGPYSSIFASMYPPSLEFPHYSFIPWVSDKKPFSITGYRLTEFPFSNLVKIMENARVKVKAHDERDLRRPLLFNGDLAASLWSTIWNEATLRIIKAKPSPKIQPFCRT